MNYYLKGEWKKFRDSIIELDGNKCTQCGRSESGVTLQVHHKRYIYGKLPWQYSPEDCITLCKGCHAAEHGIIMPKIGWEFVGMDDLGEPNGKCENENCGRPIRYIFIIFHKNWGTLEVGTICCDNLTDSELASNGKESRMKFEGRQKRFLKSKRWNIIGENYSIRQNKYNVDIVKKSNHDYTLKIHGLYSNRTYDPVSAKIKAFEVIHSGILLKYLRDTNKYPWILKELEK